MRTFLTVVVTALLTSMGWFVAIKAGLVVMPSTKPTPLGVGETIVNRIIMAYPATSGPKPTGWLNARKMV